VITIGGMLLGWIAGTMAVTDPAIANWVPYDNAPKPEVQTIVRYGVGLSGAVLVLLLGKWFGRRTAGAGAAVPATGAAAASRTVRRVLLAADGSAGSLAAARRVLALRDELREGEKLELHLVNVQRPLTGDVSRFISGKTIEEYHRENAEQALAPVRAALGTPAAQEHALVGEPGEAIAELARALDCDLIVMGARGLSTNVALLVGSVTQSTIAGSAVPVLVVK
jgi:nucleotide-binding universal stress UspA family protein